LDVAHGVPPPRAAPPLLRRVVLSYTSSLGILPKTSTPVYAGAWPRHRGTRRRHTFVCRRLRQFFD
jgi:hypothetical protein